MNVNKTNAIKEKTFKVNTNLNKLLTHANNEKIGCKEGNALKYYTEQIIPDNNKRQGRRVSVLLLFTNPHPASVRNGLFLSEGHSKTFWDRFYESEYLKKNIAGNLIDGVSRWSDIACEHPDMLASFLCKVEYISEFKFYFHCLWSYPTVSPSELFRLFGGKRSNHFQEFNNNAKEELKNIICMNNISAILAFAIPSFKEIVTEYNYGNIKGRVNRLKRAVKNNQNCIIRKFCGNYQHNEKVPVYLLMPTRNKNNKINKANGHYFTVILNYVLQDIYNNNQ